MSPIHLLTTTPAATATTPAGAHTATSPSVTLSAGVLLVLLVAWAVTRRRDGALLALSAFAAGVLLSASQLGSTIGTVFAGGISAAVTAITSAIT